MSKRYHFDDPGQQGIKKCTDCASYPTLNGELPVVFGFAIGCDCFEVVTQNSVSEAIDWWNRVK